jgi:hypothetical protein
MCVVRPSLSQYSVRRAVMVYRELVNIGGYRGLPVYVVGGGMGVPCVGPQDGATYCTTRGMTPRASCCFPHPSEYSCLLM